MFAGTRRSCRPGVATLAAIRPIRTGPTGRRSSTGRTADPLREATRTGSSAHVLPRRVSVRPRAPPARRATGRTGFCPARPKPRLARPSRERRPRTLAATVPKELAPRRSWRRAAGLAGRRRYGAERPLTLACRKYSTPTAGQRQRQSSRGLQFFVDKIALAAQPIPAFPRSCPQSSPQGGAQPPPVRMRQSLETTRHPPTIPTIARGQRKGPPR